MNLEIRPLAESEFPLWDEFVDESPRGTVFHKTFWLKASGIKFVTYGYFKAGILSAGIPLVYNTRFGIKSAFHPALTPYLGVLFKKQEAKYVTKYVTRISQEKEMGQEIARRLKNDFHSVYFQFPPGSTDLQPFLWEGFSAGVRYTYIINLDNSLEDIWKSMGEKMRNHIRKAEKDNISIVPSDDFAQAFTLFEKTLARQNRRPQSKSAAFSYNEALRQRNQCKSFLAKDNNGNAIATAYIVWDNKRSYYLVGGYDSEKSHHGALALALWEAIKFTKEELGLREFDFEGSMVPQIEQFFRKFGGEQTPYYTVSWNRSYLEVPLLVRQRGATIFARLRSR